MHFTLTLKKKKEKKNFRKGDFDIGCLQFDSLLLCSEIKNNTSLYNAHLEIVSVMKHSKQGSVRTANGFNISSEQKNWTIPHSTFSEQRADQKDTDLNIFLHGGMSWKSEHIKQK